jgi:protein ImuB
MCESSPETAASRRILALVMPSLLVEVVERTAPERAGSAFGVVLVDERVPEDEPLRPTLPLDAVSPAARRYGVRPGQTMAEAGAFVAGFEVRRLKLSALTQALATVAEVALAFGATVALGPPDIVWVDITGSSHLFGGEAPLAEELATRVRALGHAVRLAVAPGPALAGAFARWSPPQRDGKDLFIVPAERTESAVRELPIVSLPLSAECLSFLVRLGVLTLGDLAALPRQALGSRLEGETGRALELAAGRDPAPLTPFQPALRLVESVSFEHGVNGTEPLLFALRGLAARLSGRLAGRGLAAESLALYIEQDRSVARLRGEKPNAKLRFSLATPLNREEEIRRIVGSRLDRTRLGAPSVGLRLEAPSVVPANARQLELGGVLAGGADVDQELPLVLAELAADVGEAHVGVLSALDAHRLEARSTLVPALAPPKARSRRHGPKGPRSATPIAAHVSGAPLAVVEGIQPGEGAPRAPLTRLLPTPVELDVTFARGATVAVDRRLYSIESVSFEQRLSLVEWWTRAPVARDYVRLSLKGTDGVVEALAYVDRRSGKRYLQAVAD